MTAPEDETRPAGDRPEPKPTVRPPRVWQPDPRHARALDRHIAQTYGVEWVRWSRP